MINILTSRERVWRAVNHQEPDRIPIDIGGTKVTGIHVDEYIALGKYLGIDIEPPKVYEQWQMLARVDELIMKYLHSDVIQLENPIETWDLENCDWRLWETVLHNKVLMPGGFNPIRDNKGYLRLYDSKENSIAFMAPDSLYFDKDCATAMTDDITMIDPETWKKSMPLYTEDQLRQLENRAKYLYEYTDYSIHGGFLKGGLGTNGIFAGHTITDWLCILASEEDYAYAILRATAERTVQNLEVYLQAVGKYIDTILVSGTDFGTQNSELFNPCIFKKLYLPNYKMINDYIHNHSMIKTMFHSCGSVWNIIGYLIEAGVDILNPVQTNARHMEPSRLKEQYGGELVFWGGGIETQTTLPYGNPEEVTEQVKDRVKIFGPEGGFVFSPIHNLQYGVPPQNIDAMIRAVLEYGRYPVIK